MTPPHFSPSHHSVSLPSIHEMFPDHLLRAECFDTRQAHSQYGHAEDPRSARYHRSTVHADCSTPQKYSSSSPRHPRNTHKDHSHQAVAHSIAHGPRPRFTHDSDATHSAQRKLSDSHAHSFDVLRSDPASSSLQHLTSSAKLPARAANPQQLGSNSVVASGSCPAFRVSVAPANVGRGPSTPSSGPVDTTHPSRHHHTYSTGSDMPLVDPRNPGVISFPISRPAATSSKPDPLFDDGSLSDDDGPGDNSGKKHVCPTCLKRFNRPSSLRIHVNTHTGATPFRCPWPNCGREFNVNSNMRRHYRNHTTPGLWRTQPSDNRRKRRRVSVSQPPLPHPISDHFNLGSIHRQPHPGSLVPSPQISHFCSSDESDDSDMDGEYGHPEKDEMFHETHRPISSRSAANITQSMARVAVAHASTEKAHDQHRAHPYSPSSGHSHVQPRPYTPRPNFHSSSTSTSASPSPPPNRHSHSQPYTKTTAREHVYTPSAPYSSSLSDTRVSTALRPATDFERHQ